MTATDDLARMVPGFDFLQGLMKNAGSGALPGMNQWIAPTLDPKELDKRIGELRTVQFWLESNAKLLGTTIQALEVQRLTLSTLQTMNLPLAGLGEALKIRPAAPAPAPAPAPPASEAAAPAARRAPAAPRAPRKVATAAGAAAAPAAPAVDPMQWWGALTQQFTELATKAIQDSAEAAKQLPAAVAKGPAGSAAAKPDAAPAGKAGAAAKATRAPRRR